MSWRSPATPSQGNRCGGSPQRRSTCSSASKHCEATPTKRVSPMPAPSSRPTRCAASHATARSSPSSWADVADRPTSAEHGAPCRYGCGGSSSHATSTAYGPAATHRLHAATPTTSSIGPMAVPPTSTTSRCCATPITTTSTSTATDSSEVPIGGPQPAAPPHLHLAAHDAPAPHVDPAAHDSPPDNREPPDLGF